MFRPIAVGVLTWVCWGGGVAWAQVKLEYKYPPNTTATTLETFSMSVKAIVNNENVNLTGDSRLTSKAEYLPPADNLIPVKLTVAAAAIGNSANGQTYMFDSALGNATKSDNPEFDKEVETLKAVIGSTLTYQVGADGRVARVEGIQPTISKAPAEAVKGLEERLNEQKLKDEFEQQVRLVPDTPVQPGDTWQRTEEAPIPGGSMLAVDRVYEYIGTIAKDGRQVDQIKITDKTVRLMLPANDIGLTLKDSDLKVQSSEGTLFFDREIGAVLERNVTTRVTGKITLQAGGNDIPVDLDLKFTRSNVRQK